MQSGWEQGVPFAAGAASVEPAPLIEPAPAAEPAPVVEPAGTPPAVVPAAAVGIALATEATPSGAAMPHTSQ